jgi:glycerophosphoryl diester phosphodiesterase
MFELRRERNGRPLLIGHRGAMDVAPENTLPAFEAGLAGGADLLELDVQLTADQQVVLFHDTDLQYKTGIRGQIGDFTAEFLQTLDVGNYFDPQFAGLHMPFLHEILAWAKDRVALMIELKHGPIFDPRLDQHVVRLIEQHGMADQVVLISFDQFALRRVKQLNPNLTTSLIYVGRFCDPLALIGDVPVDALSPATDFLTQDEVKLIQKAGYACTPGGFYWDYPTLLNWGVDTISTNNPGAFSFQ